MALRSLPQVPVPEPVDAEMVEIQLGHMCNNRCVFCSSGHLTQLGEAAPMDLPPVLAALDRAKRRGARKITLLGGEPTLQRAFIPALRYATELGFEEIEIFTNGVKASRASFVDEVAAIGRFSWRFSVQGGDRETHDATTKKPGAFDRITAAMVNARSRGHRITANVCVNELNYRSLPEYPGLVREYGLEQLHVDMVRPVSVGERPDGYLDDIIPRHSDVAPYLDEMLTEFEAWNPNFDVNVGNFPPCTLVGWAHRIHHGGQPTVTEASRADNTIYAKDKYAFQAEDKRYGPRCDACVLRARCGGVFSDYLEIHGSRELEPVTLTVLGRHPRHDLARASAPWVERLAGAAPPAPWASGPAIAEPDEGRISVGFDLGRVRSALRLEWTRPGRRSAYPLLDDAKVALTVVADPDVDLRAIPALARWIHERLSDLAGPSSDALSPAAIVAACIDHDRLERARLAIGRAIDRLSERRDSEDDGWRYVGSTPDPHWPGARVEFAGADGHVTCSLRAHHRRVGPTVVVEADAPSSIAPERVQSCLRALKRSLAAG